MESSIAVFLWRRPACERLPTKQFHKQKLQCTALIFWILNIENARWSFQAVMLHLRLALWWFVDCTRTGSLLQWFLQLTFDFSDTDLIHEDEYTSALLGRHLVTLSWWAANALVDWMDYKQHTENARWSCTMLIHHLFRYTACLCFNLRLQQLNLLLLHWWRYIQSLSSEQTKISEMQPWKINCENARWSFLNAREIDKQESVASQRSLHNAPIFRLLLKVAVNGTHQCDFHNFWGTFGSQRLKTSHLNLKASCAIGENSAVLYF